MAGEDNKDTIDTVNPFKKQAEVAQQIRNLLTGLFTDENFLLAVPEDVNALSVSDKKVYEMLTKAKSNFGKPEILNPLRPQIEGQFDSLHSPEALGVLKKFIIEPPKTPPAVPAAR